MSCIRRYRLPCRLYRNGPRRELWPFLLVCLLVLSWTLLMQDNYYPITNELLLPTIESIELNKKPHAKFLSLRKELNLPNNNTPTGTIHRPILIGHRGALYDALENTLESFQHCVHLGCDGVELDVFSVLDGTLVVFHGGGTDEHPGDLSNYCIDMEGISIMDLDYLQIQQLVFNENYADFGCDENAIRNGRIPKLEKVLLLLKDTTIRIKIELKGKGTVLPTLELVEAMDMVDQCSFSSFDFDRLAELRRLRPKRTDDGTFIYKTGALFNKVPLNFLELANDAGASEVHLRYDTCTVDRIQAIHSHNMKSMAWFRGPMGMKSDASNKWNDVGNEDDAMYLVLAETGVQELCLNRPSVAVNLWNNKLSSEG